MVVFVFGCFVGFNEDNGSAIKKQIKLAKTS